MTRTDGSEQPKQQRARRTRQAVLVAAAESFAELGYPATAVSDIAARAGVTKGAMYFHFPTKEGLAVSIVEEFYRRWPPLVERVRAESATALDAIAALMTTVAEQFRDDVVVRAAVRLQAERALVGADLPAPYESWITLVTGLFETAAQAGELRRGADPAALARVTVGAFFGIQQLSEAATGRADVTERVAELWELLRPAIQAP
ncbi:ScbR family autoregulator-binding transcription factor [Nonomuraea wenchangensis]